MKEGTTSAGLCYFTPGQIGWYESPCFALFFELPGEEYLVDDTPTWLTTADIDGDGDQDVISAIADDDIIALLENQGDGIFKEPAYWQAGDRPMSVSATDLNGDGSADVATANNSSNNVSILISNGDGTFQDKVDYAVGSTPTGIASADLDGDDDFDLAVSTLGLDRIALLTNNH